MQPFCFSEAMPPRIMGASRRYPSTGRMLHGGFLDGTFQHDDNLVGAVADVVDHDAALGHAVGYLAVDKDVEGFAVVRLEVDGIATRRLSLGR